MDTRFPETERLYFRHFTKSDAPMLLEMHRDPEITRYTGDPVPWTDVPQVEKILAEAIFPQYENRIGRWAVHLKSSGEFIGWCGLKNIGDETDLGYRFIRKFWGNGYAFESAAAVLAYGIRENVPNIIGRAAVANVASVRVLEKIGLTFAEFYDEDGVASVRYRLA